MKPRFVVVRHTDSSWFHPAWGIFDLRVRTVVETCPTRKQARARARELNMLATEWKADAQGAAE